MIRRQLLLQLNIYWTWNKSYTSRYVDIFVCEMTSTIYMMRKGWWRDIRSWRGGRGKSLPPPISFLCFPFGVWAPVYKNIIYNLNQVKLSQGTKKLLVYLNFQQNLDHQFVLNFHQNVLFIVRTPAQPSPASGSDQELLRSLQQQRTLHQAPGLGQAK